MSSHEASSLEPSSHGRGGAEKEIKARERQEELSPENEAHGKGEEDERSQQRSTAARDHRRRERGRKQHAGVLVGRGEPDDEGAPPT